MVAVGLLVFALVAVACFVFAVDAFFPSAAGFIGGFVLFGFANGIIMPVAWGAGLAHARYEAGIVAGVLGASQYIISGTWATLAAAVPLPPTLTIGTTALAATI